MIKTWYDNNKKSVEQLLYNIRQTRMSNQLEGIFDLKPTEQCITMMIGDSVRLKGEIEKLEKEIETLKKVREMGY